MEQIKYNRKFDRKVLKKKYVILPDTVCHKDDDNMCQNYEMYGLIDESKTCFMNCQECMWE